MRRREDLTTPRRGRRFDIHYDPDAFGQFSEAVARTLGTARFLVVQTVLVVVWISLNVAWIALRWDKYPFILLNLAFSTQAAYAAPLILLAQNRQAERDRAQTELDRVVTARTQADAEFVARELASVRLALADVVTVDDLTEHLDRLTNAVERLERRLDAAGEAIAVGEVDEMISFELDDVRPHRGGQHPLLGRTNELILCGEHDGRGNVDFMGERSRVVLAEGATGLDEGRWIAAA